MALAEHQRFVQNALPRLQKDERLLGLGATGAWITGELDKYSELELLVVADPLYYSAVLDEKDRIADELGPCLARFSGDHLGQDSLLVCLYDDPLLHVNMKFVSLDDLSHRVENPKILWEREEKVTRALEGTKPELVRMDLQWMEDRFWTWLHYAAMRLGRGELFEVLDVLAFFRGRVLGPLALEYAGKPPRGVRRIEQYCKEESEAMRATVAAYDARSCESALKAAAKIYLDLRESLASTTLQRNRRAEMAALRFLHEVCEVYR